MNLSLFVLSHLEGEKKRRTSPSHPPIPPLILSFSFMNNKKKTIVKTYTKKAPKDVFFFLFCIFLYFFFNFLYFFFCFLCFFCIFFVVFCFVLFLLFFFVFFVFCTFFFVVFCVLLFFFWKIGTDLKIKKWLESCLFADLCVQLPLFLFFGTHTHTFFFGQTATQQPPPSFPHSVFRPCSSVD